MAFFLKKKGKVEGDWRYQQHFGDINCKEVKEEDIISALEFDAEGKYLAIGDGGGRIVILKKNPTVKATEFQVLTEFQSHEMKFDTLKSEEIPQQIKQIKWIPKMNDSLFLLTSNAKTVKLWKIYRKTLHRILTPKANGRLELPKLGDSKVIMAHQPKKEYKNAHEFTINSVSTSSDGETFLSADDLRINLWHLDHPGAKHTIVDIKPDDMKNLSEVITSASFHNTDCNQFLYTTTSGVTKLCDLRVGATCTNQTKDFKLASTEKGFFSETIAAVSDAKFSPDGRYILSRDYMTLKIWDVNMERRPLKTLYVHESLRAKLYDLYENDCIFDKFDCHWSGDGKQVLSGSYKNTFNVFDIKGKKHYLSECSRKLKPKKEATFSFMDFTKKVLRTAWHPTDASLAIATVNSLYIVNGNTT